MDFILEVVFLFSFPCNVPNMHFTYRLADASMFDLGYASNEHHARQENMKTEVH